MIDSRVEKLAGLLVDYSLKIRPGDKVVVTSGQLSLPLQRSIFIKTLQAGGFPLLVGPESEIEELLCRFGSREQIEYVHEIYRTVVERYDVRIRIIADSNTRSLSNIDPVKIGWFDKARADLLKTFLRRAAEGKLRWTVAPYPTEALAQDADMSLFEYEDFVFSACMPDINDPVSYWQRTSKEQQRIVDWLNGKKEIHILGKDTDLRLNVSGRRFINCDGHENMPDGEIFTSPVDDSAQGHVYFSYPAVETGHEVVGVRLWFEKGKVVKATADKNEDFLLKSLDTDAGSRFLGEFAIGTNYAIKKFTRETLFNEKIGGTFHLALGAAYPEAGGRNESSIHWDIVSDLIEGEIRVDGQLLHKGGKFVI